MEQMYYKDDIPEMKLLKAIRDIAYWDTVLYWKWKKNKMKQKTDVANNARLCYSLAKQGKFYGTRKSKTFIRIWEALEKGTKNEVNFYINSLSKELTYTWDEYKEMYNIED